MDHYRRADYAPTVSFEQQALYHEAGHTVTAWALGVPFEYVTVDPDADNPHLKLVDFVPPDLMQAYAVTLAAGRAAERATLGLPSLIAFDTTGRSDDRELYRVARFCLGENARYRRIWIRHIRRRAAETVARHHDDICVVAGLLARRTRLTAKDVHLVLGRPPASPEEVAA